MENLEKLQPTEGRKKKVSIGTINVMPVIKQGDQEFHISHDEEEKLNEFQSISGFPEDDLADIIRHLQSNSWNLELALGSYFDGNWKEQLNALQVPEPEPVVETLPPVPERVAFTPHTSNGPSSFMMIPSFPVVKKLPMGFKDKYRMLGINSDTATHLVTNPFLLILLFVPKLLFKLGTFIWTLLTMGFTNHLPGHDRNASVREVPQKPQMIEMERERLSGFFDDRINSLIEWNKSYNEVLETVQNEFKFGLVILIGDILGAANERFDEKSDSETVEKEEEPFLNGTIDLNSQKFIEKIIGDDSVIDLLEMYRDDLVIYCGSVVELEPWLVSKQFGIKYTPECFIVGNVINGDGNVNKLSLLSRIKVNSSKRFQTTLKAVFDRFRPDMVVSRTERNELELARKIRQSQEEAYQNSLRKDQIKEQEKTIIREEKRLQELEEKMKKIKETYGKLKWLNECLLITWTELYQYKYRCPWK